jgi:peptidoglycan/xylan/chitin deacetylase (PgdA/CDA1 family)
MYQLNAFKIYQLHNLVCGEFCSMTMRSLYLIYILLSIMLYSVNADGTIRRIRVPILMYHYVSPLPPQPDNIRQGLTVSPDIFREHIEFLKSDGYETISLYEINDALQNGTPLPEKPIVLTFDDGYIDHYQYVFPVLKEYGYTGTFFVNTGFTDNNNPNHLTWEQVEEMANAGMSMESHTKTHSTLANRDYDFLIWEIVGSIESLEAHTGKRPQMLAYPVGKYDDYTLSILDSTTITRAVTTEYGTYQTLHDALLTPRLRVTGNMGVAGLRNLLDNAP